MVNNDSYDYGHGNGDGSGHGHGDGSGGGYGGGDYADYYVSNGYGLAGGGNISLAPR
jgi:hypothetical protein